MTGSEAKRHRLIKLVGRNVYNLKAVSFEPRDRRVTRIGGPNGAGKTNLMRLLDLIRGAKGVAEHGQVIREGAKKGEVVVELDGLWIRKTFSASGAPQLRVEDAEGHAIRPPQERLNRLFGLIGFDPRQFMDLDVKGQARLWASLAGKDLDEIDARRQTAYNLRREVNAKVKETQAVLTSLNVAEDVPDEEVDIAELMQELGRRQSRNQHNAEARQQLSTALGERAHAQQEVARIKGEIKRLERQLSVACESERKLAKRCQRTEKEVGDLLDQDEDEIVSQINASKEVNSAVAVKRRRRALITENRERRLESERLTEQIAACDAEMQAAVGAAGLGDPDIGFGPDGTTYKGAPLARESEGNRMRIACRIGIRACGELPVLVFPLGALLDGDNERIIAEECERAGAYALIEKVGKGDDCDLIIEDGEIVEDRRTDDGDGKRD